MNHIKTVSENIDNNNRCHGMCGKGDFKNLQKSTLYYHLRELESVGIIKSENKRSGGIGAPEKIWKLSMEIEVKIFFLIIGLIQTSSFLIFGKSLCLRKFNIK